MQYKYRRMQLHYVNIEYFRKRAERNFKVIEMGNTASSFPTGKMLYVYTLQMGIAQDADNSLIWGHLQII